jgi:hypothetical protein
MAIVASAAFDRQKARTGFRVVGAAGTRAAAEVVPVGRCAGSPDSNPPDTFDKGRGCDPAG